jgi:polyisoprenoid-binding protein YceI
MKTRLLFFHTLTGLLILTPMARGQETILQLDPARTHIQFTLSSLLHTVHGTFKMKRAEIRYDFAAGQASGEIVIDAQSGDSGSGARDRKMNKNVLESDRYAEIVFAPDRVEGTLAKANVHGMFRIHGQEHELTLVVTAVPVGDQLEVTGQFIVPYVRWGMKDPSTLFLKVGDSVTIDVHASGHTQ